MSLDGTGARHDDGGPAGAEASLGRSSSGGSSGRAANESSGFRESTTGSLFKVGSSVKQLFIAETASYRKRVKQLERMTIHPNSRFIGRWDMVTIVALIYTASVTPFEARAPRLRPPTPHHVRGGTPSHRAARPPRRSALQAGWCISNMLSYRYTLTTLIIRPTLIIPRRCRSGSSTRTCGDCSARTV